MNYKLIAADIDGTLVNSKKELTPRTKNAVSAFIEHGGIFVIASGRPLKGIMRYIDELDMRSRGGYVISYNGSFIIDASTLSPIRQCFIDTDIAKNVIKIADSYNMSITTYIDSKAYTQRAKDEYYLLETRINNLERVYVDCLYDAVVNPVPKFLITGEGDLLAKYEEILKNELTDVTVFRSEPFFLEIVPKSVDKGASLEYLGKYLKIPKTEIMACGDGFNDVSLLKASGFGVAMGNAQKPVLECADYITLTNDEDGLAQAIEKFVL